MAPSNSINLIFHNSDESGVNQQDLSKKNYFANIIVPRPIPGFLVYSIPKEFLLDIQPGIRVIIPLGNSKFCTGIVAEIHNDSSDYSTKDILEIVDKHPVMNISAQLPFFQWIAQYYICTLGEVLNAALPSALKISSESRVQVHPEFSGEIDDLSAIEMDFFNLIIEKPNFTLNEFSSRLGKKSMHAILKSLTEKQVVLVYEQMKDKYSPKVIKKISLAPIFCNAGEIKSLLNSLEKKEKQLDVFLYYLSISNKVYGNNKYDFIDKYFFDKEDLSASSLNTLIKKEIFIEKDFVISRFENFEKKLKTPPILSAAQNESLLDIERNFETKEVVLLHGVTGSGKTEIYIQLINKAISDNKRVLYLLPEIAITTQLISRLMVYFGDKLGVYHSKYSDQERAEVWHNVLKNKYDVVIGVRSAIFLPIADLSLIIVDEEHENSFKQQEVAPRYNARDTATVLAKIHGAKVLLGSATPSLESYYSAKSDRYGYVSLSSRYGDVPLPNISLVNTFIARKCKAMKEEFSNTLMEAIQSALDKKEQVLIFQNRRGYAPSITCGGCGWVPNCIDCSVSLTYHQLHNYLRCHYCGFHIGVPSLCKECGSAILKNVGFGTEKLEESIKSFFPEKRVQRIDLETTKAKSSYERIIKSVEDREVDILVGTQMVAKGLDFNGITLVGVMQVDRLLHMPDFRANEKCFQLITQVIGRAGRGSIVGSAIIQTVDPKNKILQDIIANDYTSMYNSEIAERKAYDYPPFVRLVKITLCHKSKIVVEDASNLLFSHLRAIKGIKLKGPLPAPVAKVRQFYLIDIWVKIPRTPSSLAPNFKLKVQSIKNQLSSDKNFRSVRILFDVDPC